MKKYLLLIFLCLATQLAPAQELSLVKDINKNLDETVKGPDPRHMVEMNGQLYFSGKNDLGFELWRSDGTTTGTEMVIDIYLGYESSSPSDLFVFNNTLFFTAIDKENGRSLWKSDGTSKGTQLLKDFENSDPNGYIFNFIGAGNIFYFVAEEDQSGLELWRSDGTESGTIRVKDINEGVADSSPQSFRLVGGILYFEATDAASGREVWRSDGTESGTNIVKDIRPGVSSSIDFSWLSSLGNEIFFIANDGVHGSELWKSDGTEIGTQMVKDFTYQGDHWGLATIGGKIFFSVKEVGYGRELWVTDGTEQGTTLVKDITPGSDDSNIGLPFNFNSTLLFTLRPPNPNADPYIDLYSTDGTENGTQLIKRVALAPGFTGDFAWQLEMNNVLYFRTPDNKFWRTDGSESGTFMVKDIFIMDKPTILNDKLYFAYGGLWSSDGTEQGTVQVMQQDMPSAAGSFPLNFTETDNYVFFVANDGVNGYELWRTNGTENGTTLVKNINPDPTATPPQFLKSINNEVYFVASDGIHGTELWKSDGTDVGTYLVKDIWIGPSGSFPSRLTVLNEILYFSANDGVYGTELWRTDGTEAGTVLAKDVYPGEFGSNPLGLTNVSGSLYFSAAAPSIGRELWKSDGTESGTTLVKDIYSGQSSSISGSSPDLMAVLNGQLILSAMDQPNNREIWISDGTESGTKMLRDINLAGSSNLEIVAIQKDKIYFMADDGIHGFELWKSDGTESGTQLVKDATNQGSSKYNGRSATLKDSILYIVLDDGIHGYELWRSNGTEEGTNMIKEIVNLPSRAPNNLTVVDDDLFFIDNNLNNNFGFLWRSNGSNAGTHRVSDYVPAGSTTTQRPLGYLNGQLIFSGYSHSRGMELYKYGIETSDPIIIFSTSSSGRKDKILSLPVKAKKFTDVIGMQFTIDWDPAIVTYTGVEQFGLEGLSETSFGITDIAIGKLVLSWTTPGLVPQTLSDESTLFNIKFTLTGAPGSSTPVSISGSVIPIEIIGKDYAELEYETIAGSISIEPNALISGTILHHGSGLEYASVLATDMATNNTIAEGTDVNGKYIVTVPAGADYKVKGFKPGGDLLQYLDAADLASIRRHILKTETFTTPYQYIAADVNQSRTITTLDIVRTEAVILGFEHNMGSPQWRFVPSDFVFDDTDLYSFPQEKVFTTLVEDVEQNYEAVCLGDVVNSNVNSGRKASVYTVEIAPQQNEGELKAFIRGYGLADLSALQLSLQWDTLGLRFREIENNSINIRMNNAKVSEGILHLLWDDANGKSQYFADGEILFTMTFDIVKDTEKSHEQIIFSNKGLPALGFDQSLKSSALSVRWADAVEFPFSVSEPFPNPFQQSTQVRVMLQEKAQTLLTVMDGLGRVIYSSDVVCNKGANVLTWKGTDREGNIFPPSIYIMKIQVGTFTKTVKVLKEH